MTIRLLYFLGIASIGFLLPAPLLFVASVLYTLRYSAYELLALGVVLDVTYGVSSGYLPFPFLYTGAALAIICIVSFVRPYLRLSPGQSY